MVFEGTGVAPVKNFVMLAYVFLLLLPLHAHGLEPSQGQIDYLRSLKDALESEDRAWIAENVHYPLAVIADNGTVYLRNQEELLQEFDIIFSSEVRDAVRNVNLDDFFNNWRGIIIFGRRGSGLQVRITTYILESGDVTGIYEISLPRDLDIPRMRQRLSMDDRMPLCSTSSSLDDLYSDYVIYDALEKALSGRTSEASEGSYAKGQIGEAAVIEPGNFHVGSIFISNPIYRLNCFKVPEEGVVDRWWRYFIYENKDFESTIEVLQVFDAEKRWADASFRLGQHPSEYRSSYYFEIVGDELWGYRRGALLKMKPL